METSSITPGLASDGPLLSGDGSSNVTSDETGLMILSQQQEIDNNEAVPLYMQHMTTILVILHMSVFITGLVGNSLVCLSVYRNKSLQTVTNYYIVNLAVADFLVILICLPPTVYWDLTLTWNFGLVLCKLVLYLQSISVSVSVLTLTCISIDRWYAICRPLEFISTKYRAKITIALIWLVSMLIASPDVVFLTTRPLYEENNYIYMDCTYSWPESNTKMYQLCIVTLLFVGPFVLMSISYLHIVNVLWRNETMADSLMHSIQLEDEQQIKRRMDESIRSKEQMAHNGIDDRMNASHHKNQLSPEATANSKIITMTSMDRYNCIKPNNPLNQQSEYGCSIASSDNKKEEVFDCSTDPRIDCNLSTNKQSISSSDCQNHKFSAGRLCVQEKKLLTKQACPVMATSNATITIVSSQSQHSIEVCADQDQVSSPKLSDNSKEISVCYHIHRLPSSSAPTDCNGGLTNDQAEQDCSIPGSLGSYTNKSEPPSQGCFESSRRQARCRHSVQAIIIEEDPENIESKHENKYQLIREFDSIATNCFNRGDNKVDNGFSVVKNNIEINKTEGVQGNNVFLIMSGTHQEETSKHSDRQQSVNQPKVEGICDNKLESSLINKVNESTANNVMANEIIEPNLEVGSKTVCGPEKTRRGHSKDFVNMTQPQIEDAHSITDANHRQVNGNDTIDGTADISLDKCPSIADPVQESLKTWSCCKCLYLRRAALSKRKQRCADELIVGGKASKKYRKNMANYAAKRDKYRQWASESFDTSQRTSGRASKLQKETTIGSVESMVARNEQKTHSLRDPDPHHHHGEIRMASAHGTRIMGQNQQSQQYPTPAYGGGSASGPIITLVNVGQATSGNDELLATVRPNGNTSLLTNHHASSQTRFCKLIESRKKAAKMLIVIVIMFGLCYLPIHFLNILRYTIGLPQNNITTIASLVSHWLCYFNSAVNPLIYNLMSGKPAAAATSQVGGSSTNITIPNRIRSAAKE